MTHASLLIDLRRQQRVCPRLLRVTLTYRATGASLTATEELVRLPEDLAACVAKLLGLVPHAAGGRRVGVVRGDGELLRG